MDALDAKIVNEQLGKNVTEVLSVAARCGCGRPAVITCNPIDFEGNPFPTFYWLTLETAKYHISKLEASGIMKKLETEIDDTYIYAHNSYIADRCAIKAVDAIKNISAGGMPSRVKCLHALIAHSLACGPGINPIGDSALQLLSPSWTLANCQCCI